MRRLTSIAAVLTMLVMLMPMLACAATPQMSRMEQSCCDKMHGKCGEMAKQGCCQVEVRNDLNQLPAQVVNAPLAASTLVAIVGPLLIDLPASAGYRRQVPEGHSPPGLLITSTTQLRI